ncbi:Rxt2 protein [Saccharomycopsis crataegensis]|uniref:Rxt2 protein n=1 Tax=Saccharomycopsis crataegensis TaxID=43959 RepID=A0AAV5QM75_9ASCO|nr:Rxt2 protein [Saccharomycopsis crataegensis]
MSNTETVQLIRALRATLDKTNDEPLDAENYVDGETTNRGNKLKFGSSHLHRDQLNGYSIIPVIGKVLINGEEREYIQRKRKADASPGEKTAKKPKGEIYGEEPANEVVEDEEDEDNDPYENIDIRKILAPITKPEEAVTNPAICKIFQDDSLRNLASQAIDIIEYEQNNSIKLSKLLDLFLGEDPKFLKPGNMKLPDYDHELADGETVEEIKYKAVKHKNDYVIESSNDPGIINNVKAEEYISSLQTNNENKRITRNIDSNYQEVDPFFALPQFEIDSDNGVDPQIANEVRQIVQIILQRNREYIRSLQRIRSGLIRAERLKDQVYKWCKEINGDYDSEVLPPAINEKKK